MNLCVRSFAAPTSKSSRSWAGLCQRQGKPLPDGDTLPDCPIEHASCAVPVHPG